MAGVVRAIVMIVLVGALGVRTGTLTPVVSAAPLSASALYADATSRDEAVRKALDDRPTPAMSRAVKSALASYELLLRHHPTSAYSDDALWRAAQLAIHAATRLKQPALHAYAERYLAKLESAYPTSKHAKQAPELRARLSPNGRAPASRETVAKSESRANPASETDRGSASPSPIPVATAGAGQQPRSVASGGTPGANAPDVRTPARLLAVHRTVLPDVVRLTLDIDREVPFRQERLSGPARIFFDLTNTTSARSLSDRTVRFEDDSDLVRQIRIGQPMPDTLRVVLDATGIDSCHASPLYSPYRLVVDCVRESTRPAAARPSGPKPLTPGTFARKDPSAARMTPAAPARPAASPPVRASEEPALPPSPPALPLATTTHEPVVSAPAAPTPIALDPVAAPADTPPAPPPTRTPSADAAATASTSSPPPPAATTRSADGGVSLARQLGLRVSRVVVDPGHGGHDPGAKGPGITEASLVLDIALRLEALLQAEGVVVVLTRRNDEFVALETRTAIANGAAADLFLSIHANASSVPQAGGIETYYLDFANTASAAAVAARENAASGQSMNALPDLVRAIALNGKQAESRDFATHVQRALVQKLGPTNKRLRDLGVKQAPFVVLLGASMPSVLAEVSFITNEQEARLLKGQSHRQRIAEALFSAVQRYQESLTRGSRVTGQ